LSIEKQVQAYAGKLENPLKIESNSRQSGISGRKQKRFKNAADTESASV